MIITIIVWIYITFISYTWGILLLRLISKPLPPGNNDSIHFSITCFAGIGLIGTIAVAMSFFIPLGLWQVQLFFLLPSFLAFKSIFNKKRLLSIKKESQLLLLGNKVLLLCCIMTVLVMSTWTISHPDSIGYHIQIIKWIEQFKITPGIANLNPRLGFQSTWFAVCALFNFTFTGTGNYVFTNSSVTIWFLLFVIYNINHAAIRKNYNKAILWIGLFIISVCSYTQIRLTATSPSPDFITAIYILLSLYMLHGHDKQCPPLHLFLVIFFAFFAFCVKLSALPILITGIYALLKLLQNKGLRYCLFPIAIVFILLTCSLLRNAISSGYILYPFVLPDIVNKNWKIVKKKALRETYYVRAYAKTTSEPSDSAINITNKMNADEWLPIWWSNRNAVDKIILVIAAICGLAVIFQFRKIKNRSIVCAATTLTGGVFWFITAPDPRFGFGFIIGIMGIAAAIYSDKIPFTVKKKAIVCTIFSLNLLLAGYLLYRCLFYFSKNQLFQPLGVQEQATTSFILNGIRFNYAVTGCGNTAIPCIDDSSKNFSLIDTSITEGFRPKAEKQINTIQK